MRATWKSMAAESTPGNIAELKSAAHGFADPGRRFEGVDMYVAVFSSAERAESDSHFERRHLRIDCGR